MGGEETKYIEESPAGMIIEHKLASDVKAVKGKFAAVIGGVVSPREEQNDSKLMVNVGVNVKKEYALPAHCKVAPLDPQRMHRRIADNRKSINVM